MKTKNALKEIFSKGWSMGYCAVSADEIYDTEKYVISIGENNGICQAAVQRIYEAGIVQGEYDLNGHDLGD